MAKVKVRKIGNSKGIVIPKDVLVNLNIAEGEELFLLKQPGGYLLTAYDPDTDEAMRLARECMVQYRHTLRELAK